MVEEPEALIEHQTGKPESLNTHKVDFAGVLVACGVIAHTVTSTAVGNTVGGIVTGASLAVTGEKCSGHMVCQGESGSTHRNIRA